MNGKHRGRFRNDEGTIEKREQGTNERNDLTERNDLEKRLERGERKIFCHAYPSGQRKGRKERVAQKSRITFCVPFFDIHFTAHLRPWPTRLGLIRPTARS